MGQSRSSCCQQCLSFLKGSAPVLISFPCLVCTCSLLPQTPLADHRTMTWFSNVKSQKQIPPPLKTTRHLCLTSMTPSGIFPCQFRTWNKGLPTGGPLTLQIICKILTIPLIYVSHDVLSGTAGYSKDFCVHGNQVLFDPRALSAC